MFDIGDTFFLDFFKWLIFIQGYFLSKESKCSKGSVVGRSRFCRLLRDDEWTSFTWNICLLFLFLLFFSPSWESSSPVTNKSIFTTWPHLPLLPTSAVAPIYTVGFLFLWIYFGAANISVKEHIYFWCYLKRKEPLKYNEISIQEGVGKRGLLHQVEKLKQPWYVHKKQKRQRLQFMVYPGSQSGSLLKTIWYTAYMTFHST